MTAEGHLITFVVRVVASSAGVQAVVELVRTGRKTRVDSLERLGEAIAAMVAADEGARHSTTASDAP